MNITLKINDNDILKFIDLFNKYIDNNADKLIQKISNKTIVSIKDKISTRTYNVLRRYDFVFIGDITKYPLEYFLRLKNFGRKSAIELDRLISGMGLSFSETYKTLPH